MLDMGGNTRHTATVAGVCWLVEMDFSSGTVYCTTAPLSLLINGHNYLGLGMLSGVSELRESADSAAERISLSLTIADASLLALVLGDVGGYRGRPVRLYLQLLDENFQPDGAPRHRWSGVMDRTQITRTAGDPESGTSPGGVVEMQCSRAGMARARNWSGLRLTHQQQSARYPGDTGLRYLRGLIEKPTPWLSVAFLKQ